MVAHALACSGAGRHRPDGALIVEIAAGVAAAVSTSSSTRRATREHTRRPMRGGARRRSWLISVRRHRLEYRDLGVGDAGDAARAVRSDDAS
jgi:hypothetical protein